MGCLFSGDSFKPTPEPQIPFDLSKVKVDRYVFYYIGRGATPAPVSEFQPLLENNAAFHLYGQPGETFAKRYCPKDSTYHILGPPFLARPESNYVFYVLACVSEKKP